MSLRIDAGRFRLWASACVDALAAERSDIDGLNVFPVPDADTGTNAYLTFVAGSEAIAELSDDADLATVMRTYTSALLVGARGNCGVILSELVRASVQVLAGRPEPGPDDVAEALAAGNEAAWAAVGRPREGTILSVAQAASAGARAATARGDGARDVFEAAASAARDALLLTPTQLSVLAREGVVDAGGRALVVVLDSVSRFLTGRTPPVMVTHLPAVDQPAGEPVGDLQPDGPGYEVMYLLEATADAVTTLRTVLDGLGDSLVVVGGEGGPWNVHVHVDDVGAAIEAGMAAGRPYRIRVTHFAEQTAGRRTAGNRVIISAVFGEGLAELTRQAGAVAVPFTRERPLTQQDMTRILESTDATELVVLPNREHHIAAFEAAAALMRGRINRIAVIPTRVQVEALAALAVHDAGASFDDDVVAMSTAAGRVRHGAVTIATAEAMTMAGPCLPGDVLGVVSGDFSVIGVSEVEVAMDVLARLDPPSAELVTLVRGAGADPSLTDAIESRLRQAHPQVDVVAYDGGQATYRLFIAVE